MTTRTFEHIARIDLPDPDFMPIFLQPCGSGCVIALQSWCAFLIDVNQASARRINYTAWVWNVASAHNQGTALTVQFERPRGLYACTIDTDEGEIVRGESIAGPDRLMAPEPPHLVTEQAVWFAHSGPGHTLVAARFDRLTGLSSEISRISPTDFFLLDPNRTVYMHRHDVGLILPHPLDQPELVVNYRKIGCSDPRGATFDEQGKCWILDEAGPTLYRVDLQEKSIATHDLYELHREVDDLEDPSPYPWHSCVWSGDRLILGCCDAARLDILRPLAESG